MSPTSLPASALDAEFVEPPWGAALDPELELRLIPENAKISGMFLTPLITELKRVAPDCPNAQKRCVAFNFYPLREHVELLIETCGRAYPDRPLRAALRSLGRGGPAAFTASTLGKVVLGSTQGVYDRIAAICKAYELNVKPGSAAIRESQGNRILVRLENIHYFLDSHHVGVFEGTLKQSGVAGRVLIADRGRGSADLLLEW